MPKYPLLANRRGAELSSGNFPPFFLKSCFSVYNYEKSKELLKILRMLSGSSPIFALSNHAFFVKLKLVRQSF